jgi:hypothetical protein
MIECNSIPWASGNTGLVWWNTPGFESSSGWSSIYFVFIFTILWDFFIFNYFYLFLFIIFIYFYLFLSLVARSGWMLRDNENI